MKTLFIGLGGVGQRHMRNLINLRKDVQIAAVRKYGRTFEITNSLHANKEVDIIKKYGIKIYPSINEAVKFKPDFAVVANPTSLHLETCLELINKNIPVLLEKPISSSYEGLAKLVENIKNNKIKVSIGYQMRFHSNAILIKDLLENNKLGKIYSVHISINSYMPKWHDFENYKDYYVGRKDLGGGVILTEIHEIDLLFWYFGLPNRLWAIGGKLSSFDIDVEDTVNVLIEYKYNGNYFPVNLHMSYVQQPPSRVIIIRGEKGTLNWDIQKGLTWHNVESKKDNKLIIGSKNRNELFIDLMDDFVSSIVLGYPSKTNIESVLGGHQIALNIKESLWTNKIIDFKSKLI